MRPLVAAIATALLLAVGCGQSNRGANSANRKANDSERGKTAGTRVVRPERRDIRMKVVQPGTIQAFEVTPVYSRITGYVDKYRYNIGDRVKAGDVLIDMWIPDIVEQHVQKSATVKRADVQIRVTQSALPRPPPPIWRRQGLASPRPRRASSGRGPATAAGSPSTTGSRSW